MDLVFFTYLHLEQFRTTIHLTQIGLAPQTVQTANGITWPGAALLELSECSSTVFKSFRPASLLILAL